MLCFKFNQNRILNEEFDFWGLQKLAQLENMFLDIVEGWFCQKIYVCYLFKVALHFSPSPMDYEEKGF